MPPNEDPPPPYEASSSSGSQARPAQTAGIPPQDTNNLTVPLRSRNGIPPEERRSMEDSARALPDGWVRQYDRETHHQFFVDTRANPPRSIWHHPHDDEQYLSSLPEQERERIKSLQRVHSLADIEAESSDDETAAHGHGQAAASQQQQNPGLLDTGPEKLSKSEKFGRKLKDKLTSSTHQERAAKRQSRAEAERQAYYQHQHIRRQIARAVETGEPQLLGTRADGKEVWVEPPQGAPGLYGRPNAHVVNPWNRGGYFGGPPGMMAGPGNIYARPVGPYSRPYGRGGYGYGYGGGLGMAPLLGLGVGLGVGGLLF